ncbi:MAG: sigma-70 family RNA polymerase sigma factor [Clostridia bacterium]|nr:sigma-70 family RNA polymerase sigma factor [Clostridia bacterium]
MEEILVNMAKSGDKDAFTDLVNKYERKLYVIAQSRVDKEEDIKDAIQDTLLQAYLNIINIKRADSFNGWITQIMLNNCANLLRAQQRMTGVYDVITNDVSYEDNFLAIDNTVDLFSVVNMFPEEERKILIMYFSEGYTTNEISQMLNINENTIRSKISRMRKKIKEECGEEYYSNI